jgi:pilus assembly protein CpaC
MQRILSFFPIIAACLVLAFSSNAVAQENRAEWLDIELGKSIVLETPRTPAAISITNPEVANFALLGSGSKLQIQGRSIGTTDLVIQYASSSEPSIFEVTVHRDLTDLIRRIDAIVKHDPPRVYPFEERIVVQGTVDDLDTLEQIAQVTSIYDPDFINLMNVDGDHQVQLEVVFAEVSRTGLRQLGINFWWGGTRDFAGGVWPTPPSGFELIPGASGSGFGTELQLPFLQGPMNIPFYSNALDLVGMMQILDNYQLGKILAQPTLTCLSGQQCDFLAGGELPIPIPNAAGNVTIQFKDFGTKVVFVPTVLADNVIDVQVEMEMSEVDNSVTTKLAGISVPGFVSRKAKSHVRLQSGMSFAIAGLLTETVSMQRDEVPGLGRIPVIGALFRSISHTREETELVIFVTPRLVRPLAPDEIPPLPGTTENNNPSDLSLFLLGADRRFGSRTATPTGSVGLKR